MPVAPEIIKQIQEREAEEREDRESLSPAERQARDQDQEETGAGPDDTSDKETKVSKQAPQKDTSTAAGPPPDVLKRISAQEAEEREDKASISPAETQAKEKLQKDPDKFFRTKDGYYIEKSELQRIDRESPLLADVLKRAGYEPYKRAVKNENKLAQERNLAEQKRQDARIKEALSDKPPELREAYERGGVAAYNEAVEKWNAKVENQRREFEKALEVLPPELREAYERGGVDAYNEAVEKWNYGLEHNYTRLPDGNYILNSELNDIKNQKQKAILLQRGFDAYDEAMDAALRNLDGFKVQGAADDISKVAFILSNMRENLPRSKISLYLKYVEASPQERFTMLRDLGSLPANSKFIRLMGNDRVAYTTSLGADVLGGAGISTVHKEVDLSESNLKMVATLLGLSVQDARQYAGTVKTYAEEYDNKHAPEGFDVAKALIAGKENPEIKEAVELLFHQDAIAEAASTAPLLSNDALTRRTAEILIERPHLEGYQAYNIAKTELKHEGVKFDDSPNAGFDALKAMTPAELREAGKIVGIDAVGRVIPGVYTAYLWNEMDLKERAIAIGTDIAMVAVLILGIKVAGSVLKRLAGVTRAQRLAVQAGKAGTKLKKATAVYENSLANKLGGKTSIKLANKVEAARTQAVKADNAFLDALGKAEKVSPGDLAKLEKKSGLKGLKTAVQDCSRASDKVSKAWVKVDRTSFIVKDILTAEETATNNARLIALLRLQKAQEALEQALQRAGSRLKPRYSPKPPPAEFKGFRAEWKAKKPTIQDKEDTLNLIKKQLDDILGSSQPAAAAVRPALRVAVAERPVQKALQLKPVFKKVARSPKGKPSIPKVKTSAKKTLSYRPAVKTETQTSLTPAERHALGTMTAAQRQRLFESDPQTYIDVRTLPIIEIAKASKPFRRVKASEWQTVKEAVQAAVETQVKAQTKTATKQMVQQAVLEAVKAKMGNATKAQVKTISRAVMATATDTLKGQRIARPFPEKPASGLLKPLKPRLPLVTRGKSAEKEKWTQAEIDSAIAWPSGAVVHAMRAPYRRGIDEKTFNKNNLPAGLQVLKKYEGPGSPQRGIQVKGKPPARVTVDVGNQDAIVTRGRGGRMKLQFKPDRGTVTRSRLTIKRSRGGNISKKRGRVYHTRAAGGTILSRRGLRGE